MIFDHISLTNFGLYAGHQKIPLTPPSPDRPVILFGGLNGGGKTTLMDALQLCLFGAYAKTSNRGRLSYLDYLSRCIHSHSQANSASIQLSFRHTVGGCEEKYTLKRAWFRKKARCIEEFHVLKNDRLSPTLADNWAFQVESFMPANISHLFLFDGEQIERYASPADSASLIRTAIQNLLGLDLVEQLEKDMLVFERRKQSEQLSEGERTKVAETELKLRTLRTRIERAKQERASIRTHRVERKKGELAAVEEEFRRIGGDLFERRQEIEAALSNAKFSYEENSEELRELAASALPVLLLLDLLKSASKRDQEDQETTQIRHLLNVISDRDQATMEHLRDNAVEASTLTLLQDYFQKERADNEKRAGRDILLGLTDEDRRSMSALLHGQMDELKKTTNEKLSRHAQARSAVEEARSLHYSVPQNDVVAGIVKRRNALKTELDHLNIEEAIVSSEIKRLQHEIERAEKTLTLLLESDIKAHERENDRARMLRNAKRVRKTLTVFKNSVVLQHISRIEHLVLESYQQLLRKTSLVTRISIDPEKFSLILFGRSDEVMPSDSLSAGERQLLGIALHWGLAKASGRPLPTAIDTPLGRLDTDHRQHFVEHYVPFASHQTLLFSTNEEIVGDYLEQLRPSIGRCYYLNHDDKHGYTHAEAGYFEGECLDDVY